MFSETSFAAHSGRIQLGLLGLLAAWMLLTRLPDLSQLVHLRDASMAVFFIGGLLIGRALGFGALLALAVGIDLLVFARIDALHLCFTPAYAFLLPAYALLWWAGRAFGLLADSRELPALGFLALGLGVAVLAALGSFVLSNGSFYLFSGAFAELSFGGFASQFLRYAPSFVGMGVGWIALGLLTCALARARARAEPRPA
ncbi:MAG: hypothetical protein MEQ07_04170 [Aquimonas sp.]|nr:hypothetical protein [Aquimonas sp.]